MEPVDWIIAHSAPRPTIFATIQSDRWSMIAETTEQSVSLAVLQHSFLILTCVAGYPVFWHNNDETEPLQTRTYHPFLTSLSSKFGVEMNFSYIPKDPFEVPPIRRYEANLTMSNFSASMEGVYYCLFENCVKSDDRLKTELRLSMKTEPDTSIHGEVIQAGFSTPRPQITHLFRYWNTKLSIPFIYGIPQNATLTYALFTIDPNQEWPLPQPQSTNDSKILNILDFLEVEQKLLSPSLGQAIITITRGSYFHRGDFYFIIRTYSLDGAFIAEKREKFLIILDTIQYEVEVAEQLTPFDASTILSSYEFYEARMYFSNPDWINPRIAVYEQIHQTGGCGKQLVSPGQFDEICGVVSLSLFDEQTAPIVQKGLRILMYSKNPCIVTVNFDSIKTADVVSSSLYMATLDWDLFQSDRSGAKLIADPPLLDGNIAFTNESITLQCLLPKCHLFYITWHTILPEYEVWGWPPCKYSSCQACIPDSQVTYSDVSQLTISINARLSSLQLRHSGSYACELVQHSSNKPWGQPLAAKVGIQVRDPIPPIFTDGQDFQTVNQSIKEGMSYILLCKVNGLPKPELTWSWTLEAVNGSVHRQDFSDNSTFEVRQPGTYICNACNKYGWNSRTYNIQYDKPAPADGKSHLYSYIPFVIAIPVAMVLFALAALAIWWLWRRALQASFRELAKTLRESTENIPLDESTFLNDQVQFLQYNRDLEIDRSHLTVTTKLLGIGEFGSIFKGQLKMNGGVQEVAVKIPRDSLNLIHFRSLADELKIMSHIRQHVNVVQLVGACTKDIENRQLFVLTEFCENGSLKDYVVKNFMKFEGFEVNSEGQFLGAPGAVEALLKYAYQAANGMAYLSAEKIIHRDLALRNLLLTKNHIVKIADFGMSRQNISGAVYKKKLSDDVPVPVFWMALESLAYSQYTRTSDVWSFGIVLWEMFSCGKRPYPNHEPDGAFRKWLLESEQHRLGPPNIACDEIYLLMLRCWKSDPEARPSFSECKRSISRILEQRSPSVYQSMLVSLSEAWLTVPSLVTRRSNWSRGLVGGSTECEQIEEMAVNYEYFQAAGVENRAGSEMVELYMPSANIPSRLLSEQSYITPEIGYNVCKVIE